VARDFDYGILRAVAHRPWPMPDAPWVMTQTWHDLLFAHWRVEPAVLRALVPIEFELDLFDGAAWVGVVPFRMTNVGARGVPGVPWLSEFLELNVRTYVRVGARPGVYFWSLDAERMLAVLGARLVLNLPYFVASMSLRRAGDEVAYEARRPGRRPARFCGTYGPVGGVVPPLPGTLEYFLTERYCLYNLDHRDAPYRLDIHHPPWPLQPADAAIVENTMAAAAGVRLPGGPPLCHFARRQDMVAWAPVRLHTLDVPGRGPTAVP
jgi:uncharacterized protein YqjF (DUF2071 family)